MARLLPNIAQLSLGLVFTISSSAAALAQEESGGDEGDKTAESSDAAPEGQAEAAIEEPEKEKLSDRIKAVQRKVFLKRERIEIFPFFGLDLNDPFYQHLIGGAAIGYHFSDAFSAEARGGYAFAHLKQSAIKFVRQSADSLIKNPPEFRYHADLDFMFSPFYGKISLLGEGILHFDTYVTAGGGIFATDGGVNPAGNVGIGQRYFITDWLVARVELRDYMFMDTRNSESDLQNLLVLGFSVSGFFPMTFEYEYQ